MKRLSFLFLGIFLFGCTAPELSTFSLNTFKDEKKIALKTNQINIVSKIQHFEHAPHVENQVSITPYDGLKQWINNRFYPVEGIDKIDFIIEKAYLTQSDDVSPKWYVFDNVKYKLTYALKLEYKQGKNILYTQNVSGWESASLPKRSSLTEKEKVFEKMMNQMIQKVDSQIILQMPKRFLNNDF